MGRLSLLLERKEEQSFSIPARCSENEENGGKGFGKRGRNKRQEWQNEQGPERKKESRKRGKA